MDEKIKKIVTGSIEAVLPDAAVKRALQKFTTGNGKMVLVVVGKPRGRWRGPRFQRG